MNIREYFDHIKGKIENCVYVDSYELVLDERSTQIGYIKGILYFDRNIKLHFREFVDIENNEKYKYAYHLMKNNELIFRYDNSNDIYSRRLNTHPHHKHLQDDTIQGVLQVELEDVLQEIEDNWNLY